MTAASPDQDLVIAYSGDRSEAAFTALVRRHVDLVYATAFRQVGDRGLAEEITQNVFVALSRKAPQLTGLETLGGWLHRTTVFEAKAHVRAELRRRHRESVAGQLAELRTEGTATWEPLVRLLDEALLNLREGERLALVLRFLEERPLRDVGALLGVDEDAARKRVNRALARVGEFFRQRGFALPGGAAAGVSAALTQGASVTPPGLAATAAAAGLAAGPALSTGALVGSFMALTKSQTVVLAALLLAAPLTWQWQVRSETFRARAGLSAEVAAEKNALAQLDAESSDLRTTLRESEAEMRTARIRLATLAQPRSAVGTKAYRWDDTSPVMRVPKALVKKLRLDAVSDRRGKLTPQIKEVLQLTAGEESQVQAAIDRFLAGYHAAGSAVFKRVEPRESEINGRRREDVRVFELPSLTEEVNQLRQALVDELQIILDPERAEMLFMPLKYWIPDRKVLGMNSGQATFDLAHRQRFYRTEKQSDKLPPYLDWGLYENDGTGISMQIRLDEIQDYLAPQLRDWMTEAEKAHAEARQRTLANPQQP